jgi:hypothetical protein
VLLPQPPPDCEGLTSDELIDVSGRTPLLNDMLLLLLQVVAAVAKSSPRKHSWG